jgi:hypothetical protein
MTVIPPAICPYNFYKGHPNALGPKEGSCVYTFLVVVVAVFGVDGW